ncbi:hypothetical protein TI39_contig57g00001 [Zymoseptoria brevis]|uniref:Uncharacterized protein n=1 Tax=Zymoseptoria brevis TaxID=1047168 RepID=A0A0F4GY83_9PEZI|nr:hypothetical protein TI39_contig57g00001 [Zymoseptoria brevis]
MTQHDRASGPSSTRDDVWTDYDEDSASSASDHSYSSSTEQQRLETGRTDDRADERERRRLQMVWKRQDLEKLRCDLQEMLEMEPRTQDGWDQLARHCVAERLQSVESELGIEKSAPASRPAESRTKTWQMIRVVTGLLTLIGFVLQLYAIHTARHAAESSSPGPRYITTLPTVPTFPVVELTILRTPEMECIRGLESIWQILERAATQASEAITCFNTNSSSLAASWNEALINSIEEDVQARSREWRLVGGLGRDLEWAGLSLPWTRHIWAGSKAMAAVDATIREYRGK